MSSEKSLHLDEDQLLRAVVDEIDLPQALREHLSSCPQCSANKEKIENNLARLGRNAERFSPSPGKKVLLPEVKPYGSKQWSWQWRGAFGVAVAAVFILFVLGIPPLFKPGPGEKNRMITKEMLRDEELMTEVGRLAENALPSVYLDITGETDPEFDEDFIQFLIPATEAAPLTHNSGIRGGKPC